MINRIIRFSLENRLAVLLGAAIVAVAGIQSLRTADIDVFPDLTAPTVTVLTDAGGMAAEEVERLVTFPIETAVNGASNVRCVRSTSLNGSSVVRIDFDWGQDVLKARQTVSEKLMTISGDLPDGLTPVLSPQSSVMGEILFVGMRAEGVSLAELRTAAEWVVKPAILATGGVSQVTIIGGDLRQYQILADPVRMQAFGITMEMLERACSSMSVNTSGGIIREWGNEYVLRGMGRTSDLDEMAATPVGLCDGHAVTVADVADVRLGSARRTGYASLNTSEAVILSVSKQPDVNTLKVTREIERNLKELSRTLPEEISLDTGIFRQADFIESSIGNVAEALVEGAVCVILILFLFLASARTTVISVTAIPMSLLGTVALLKAFGMDINTMTLGGMCIAIGGLVDDAVIDVENVYRRLSENRRLPNELRKPALEVVYDGSREIRSSIIKATLIIITAFTPLFFLSGMEGRMLKPLGIAYITALGMSLLVAMTLTPLLCDMLLTSESYLKGQEGGHRISTWLRKAYRLSLSKAMEHGKALIIGSAALLAVAIVMFCSMGQSFLPDFNEGSLTIAAVVRPGLSLDENNMIGNLVERQLLEVPEVRSTARRTGRGELDEHSQMTNSAEIDVAYTLGRRGKDGMLDEIRERLASIPGLSVSIGQPLGHRIDHMLSGTEADVAIKLYGEDLSVLFMTANRIKAAVGQVDGVVDVSVEQQTETPQIQIRPRRGMLAAYGITMEEFNRFVRSAFSGESVGEIYEGQRSFDLVLMLAGDWQSSADMVGAALIDTADGGKVPLEQVAEIVSAGGPNTISRENVRRRIVISANLSSRDEVGTVRRIREAIDSNVSLPEGYTVDIGGQFESAESARRTLILATLAAILLILAILYAEFGKMSLSALVLVNMPLAVIGGILAVFLTGGVMSIPSVIGLITLLGIATRNGILLISHLEDTVGDAAPDRLADRIIEGSADRLNPILMTALTSALALIPMILGADRSGNEIQSPMAVVVLGGLVTSTVMNVYLVPVLYRRIRERMASKAS